MACPTCSKDGDYFAGPPKAARDHFLARMLWAAHCARQACERMETTSQTDLDELSSIINRLDDLVMGIIGPEWH